MRATSAEIPVPNSVTVEDLPRYSFVQRGLLGFVIHSAKRGVIFHRAGIS